MKPILSWITSCVLWTQSINTGLADPGDLLWVFSIPDKELHQPTLSPKDEIIVAGSDGVGLYAVDLNGMLSWKTDRTFSISNPVVSSDGERIVIKERYVPPQQTGPGPSAITFYPVLGAVGNEIWVAYPAGIGPYANGAWPSLSDNDFLIIGFQYLYGESGSGIFRYHLSSGFEWSIRTVYRNEPLWVGVGQTGNTYGLVFEGLISHGKYILKSTSDGTVTKRLTVELSSTELCLDREEALYGFNGNDLIKFTVEDGLIWTFKADEPALGWPIVDSRGNSYFVTEHHLISLDPEGQERWIWTSEGSIATPGAVSDKGQVFVGLANGGIACIDADGLLEWVFESGINEPPLPPVLSSHQRVYASIQGKLYAIETDALADENAWSQFRADSRHSGSIQRTVPPSAPLITSHEVDTRGVFLEWTSVPGASSYEVWRGREDDPSHATRIASNLHVTTFHDHQAPVGLTVHYWVRGVNGDVPWPWTESVQATRERSGIGEIMWERSLPFEIASQPLFSLEGQILIGELVITPGGPRSIVSHSYDLLGNHLDDTLLYVGSVFSYIGVFISQDDEGKLYGYSEDKMALGSDGFRVWTSGFWVYFPKNGGVPNYPDRYGNPTINFEGDTFVSTEGFPAGGWEIEKDVLDAYSKDGIKLWRYEHPGSIEIPPLPYQGKVTFVTQGLDDPNVTQLHCLTSKEGEVLWTLVINDPPNRGSWPVIAENGDVYVSTQNRITRVDKEGVIQWTYNKSAPSAAHLALGPDGTLYFVQAGLVGAISEAGELLWTHPIGDSVQAPPVIGHDMLLVCHSSNIVSAFKINPGREIHLWPMVGGMYLNQNRERRWSLELKSRKDGKMNLELWSAPNRILELQSSRDLNEWVTEKFIVTSNIRHEIQLPDQEEGQKYFRLVWP